ncbi:hypothetical protein [Mesorhizobium sp.]|uniref:hypothetical protein n=1 Tax=Mesorhizobium sp. TaxID=1871066 RepID=UPI0025C5E25A|nr:hypothetical protein [Mesorhizobium sp.]
MIKTIDRFLDHLTMYRLVLYYLMALVSAALVLGFAKLVPNDPIALAFTTALTLAACWLTNKVFAHVFAVPANNESVYITALILALILDPVAATDIKGIAAVVFASVWAISSKFILAIGRKHLLNPAALGVALSALLLDQPATWWVGGNLALLPLVLLGGMLIVRKLRRSILSRLSLSWRWRRCWPRPSRRNTVAHSARRWVHHRCCSSPSSC